MPRSRDSLARLKMIRNGVGIGRVYFATRSKKQRNAATRHIALPTDSAMVTLCGRPVLGPRWYKEPPPDHRVKDCPRCDYWVYLGALWGQFRYLLGPEWGEWVARELGGPESDFSHVDVVEVLGALPPSDAPPMHPSELIEMARRYAYKGNPAGLRAIWETHARWRRAHSLPHLTWDEFVRAVFNV